MFVPVSLKSVLLSYLRHGELGMARAHQVVSPLIRQAREDHIDRVDQGGNPFSKLGFARWGHSNALCYPPSPPQTMFPAWCRLDLCEQGWFWRIGSGDACGLPQGAAEQAGLGRSPGDHLRLRHHWFPRGERRELVWCGGECMPGGLARPRHLGHVVAGCGKYAGVY